MNIDDYAAALNETPALLRHELDALRARYRESQRWVAAKSWSDLCELSAQFCEGKLSRTPDHDGPRAQETVRIAEPLAHANRHGYLTICSQPGEDGAWQQRAAVEGWAPAATADQLRKLFAGTRIQVQVADKRSRRSDYSTAVDVSRSVDPNGTVQVHTSFGAALGRKEHFVDLGRKDLTKNTVFVTVYDPQWGDHNLLWERLAAPDWDNPPSADEDSAMPTHIPPGREHLWRRQAEADAEVRRLTELYSAAEQRAERMSRITAGHDPRLRALDAETERINTELDRAEAVAERVYQERTAGLSSWIDHDPTAPICTSCGGTGGPPGSDAHSACGTCRGWGRGDDGRPPIPVWSDQGQEWVNPATGQPVDILADPAAPEEPDAPPPAQPYQPPAKQQPQITSQTATSGAGMSSDISYDSLKARLMGISSNLTETQGPLQQALQSIEQQTAELTAAAEGGGAGVQEALGNLQRAQQSIEEANQAVGAAQQSTESAAAQLSS